MTTTPGNRAVIAVTILMVAAPVVLALANFDGLLWRPSAARYAEPNATNSRNSWIYKRVGKRSRRALPMHTGISPIGCAAVVSQFDSGPGLDT